MLPSDRMWACISLLLSILSIVSGQNTSGGQFCVALSNADPTALQEGLNWACGPGGADCNPIQPGGVCYKENDLVEIASYAYNDYYHRAQGTGATCNFSGTATLSNTDPSFGSCIFTGSSQSNSSNTTPTTTITPTSPTTPTSLFAPPPPPFSSGFTNSSSDNLGPISPGFGGAVSLQVLKITYLVLVLLHLLSYM